MIASQGKALPHTLRQSIWKRDNFACCYCGAQQNLAVDHIVPRSRGGVPVESNLLTACRSCNSSKGTKSHEEFIRQLAAVEDQLQSDDAASVEDKLRNALRRYQRAQGIGQIEYAARLGVVQSRLSAFIGVAPVGKLGVRLARAICAYHPELTPLIMQWAFGDDAA